MSSGLGELERAVMDVLWDHGAPLTGRQVLAALTGRELAYTTVVTVLDRLSRKDFVTRELHGRAWLYRPAAARETYVAQLMLEALSLTGDRAAALTRFAHSVSDPDAEALRRALTDPDTP